MNAMTGPHLAAGMGGRDGMKASIMVLGFLSLAAIPTAAQEAQQGTGLDSLFQAAEERGRAAADDEPVARFIFGAGAMLESRSRSRSCPFDR